MARQQLTSLRHYLNQQVLGQSEFIEQLLIALLCGGHLLVESPPGLAKTRAIKALSHIIDGNFQRIQFTPDLLPSDITGTDIFRMQTNDFVFQRGPIFHNLLLADEINRAPAKVQSALLEAMAENQVTVGQRTYKLPKLFMVMATQNPLEQEGTYPLPEAQLDRFLFKIELDYPDSEQELAILELNDAEAQHRSVTKPVPLTQDQLFELRDAIMSVHLAPALKQYIVDLVIATRHSERYDPSLANWIEYGASPRATIALARSARAYAFLQDRDFVTPDDIQKLANSVLRHRVLLSYQAIAQGVTPDMVIQRLLEYVSVA